MSEDDTVIMEAQEATEYQALDEAGQREMVHASLLNLERLHLECRINLAINAPDTNMSWEDGSKQTLQERMNMLDDKLAKFREAFKDLM